VTSTADRQAFREVLATLAARTKTKIPTLNGRVEKAVKLALAGDVELHDDGTATVYSSSDPTRRYEIRHGTCTCRDYEQAPEQLCQHRLSAGLVRRTRELLPAVPVPQPEAPVEMPHGIEPRHIVLIQGKPFVKFAGLLDLAHQRGLQALKVDWTFNDAELSLAHAVAVFPFGTFEESGDATPANVNRKVAPHFRRCALTRAAARVLRDALNCDMVALEELADE
jgi:hypothetical protein